MTDEAGLAERLRGRGIEPKHADGIARWVYRANELNRIGYTELCSQFEDSPFDLVLRKDNAFHGPSAEQLTAIAAGGYNPEDRYEVSGVTHIMHMRR